MSDVVLEEQTAFAEIIARMLAWGLPPDDVEYILRTAVSTRQLQPRENLFAQDAPVTHVYLLKRGTVFLERTSRDRQGRRRITLRREVKPGELIGHYDLLYDQRYNTRARALEASHLISVEAHALNRLIYRFPNLRHQIAPLDKIGRLRTIPLFGHLDLTVLSYIADTCKVSHFPADHTIYKADSPAELIYVIDQGQVELQWDGNHRRRRWMGNGMAFGFLNSIFGVPPTGGEYCYDHEAVTTSATTVFTLPRRSLIEIADLNPERMGHVLRQSREQVMKTMTVVSKYSEENRLRLLGFMSHYHVPIPHLIMQQGEMGDSMWILMPGSGATLRAIDEGQALQPTPVYGPNFFSELALRVEHPLDSTVQADANSQWLRLHREDFQIFLHENGETLLEQLTMSPAAERLLGQQQTRERYSWLQTGEKLLVLQRRHWLVLVKKTFISLVIFGILGLVYLAAQNNDWNETWQTWLFAIAVLLATFQFLWGLIDYLNDYILVTNQRIVRQEKVLYFTEWRQAAFLEQIRNVDVETTFTGKIFDFGDLRVQTAAAQGSIFFDYVPGPHSLKQIILEQQSFRQQHFQASSKMVIQNLLEDRLGLRLRMPAQVCQDDDGRDGTHAANWWQRIRGFLNMGPGPGFETADRIVWRKHWFILLGKVALPITLLLLVLLLLVLGQQYLPASVSRVVALMDVLLVFLGLGIVAWIAWSVADWRNDTYEIDTKQIADVEKKPLFFSEQRRTALLGEIENITVSIPSPLHHIFNFGNVRLQTAATEGEFTFDWVPDPRGVSEEVRRRIEIYRQEQESIRARQRAEELPDWFEMYNRLGSNNNH